MPRRGLLGKALDFTRGGLLGLTTDVLGAPVDLATMAMRPFGYQTPSDQVVGSSDWIASKLGAAPTGSGTETAGRIVGGFATPSGLAKGMTMAMPFLAAKLSPEAEAAVKLAEMPQAFRFKKSESTDFERIMRGINPRLEVKPRNWGGDTEKVFEIKNPRGEMAYVVVNKDGTVELDISEFTSGSGGSGIYQAIGDYAANRGLTFIGDPRGLSYVAQVRRTPNMLSSALRHGQTGHIAPHELQITPEVQQVAPLSWRAGDDTYNLNQLVDSHIKTYQNLVPEIRDIRYNPVSKRFEDGAGNEVKDSDFDLLVKRARKRDLQVTDVRRGMERTPPVGRADLKRTAFLQSSLQGLHAGGLGELRGKLPEYDFSNHPALKGLLYGLAGALPAVGLLSQAQDYHAP